MAKPKQPLEPKEAIKILSRLELIEYALEAVACEDNGPLTSSPAQRRNMAIVLRALAGTFRDIATTIDPLGSVSPLQDIPLPALAD